MQEAIPLTGAGIGPLIPEGLRQGASQGRVELKPTAAALATLAPSSELLPAVVAAIAVMALLIVPSTSEAAPTSRSRAMALQRPASL